MNNNSFCTKIGVNPTVVHNIVKGRNMPSYEVISKIVLSFDNIDANWLITGNGSMLRNEAVVKEAEAVHVAPAGNTSDLLDRIVQLSKDNGVLEARNKALEARIAEMGREKKAEGTIQYGAAADKVVKYGREEM